MLKPVKKLSIDSVADPDPNPPDPHVWASWIRILVRGMDPDPSSKKNLDSYCFVTSFWLYILVDDVNVSVPSQSENQKNYFNN